MRTLFVLSAILIVLGSASFAAAEPEPCRPFCVPLLEDGPEPSSCRPYCLWDEQDGPLPGGCRPFCAPNDD